MNVSPFFLVETAALLAVAPAFEVAILAFRNPLAPSWTKRDAIGGLATAGFVAWLSLVAAMWVAEIVTAGMDPRAALALALGLVLLSGIAGWRLGDFGDRIGRADAGLSPFHPANRPPTVANVERSN